MKQQDTRQEMPLFTRTYDLMAWLIPVTEKFPRPLRHSFTKRLLDASFDLRERLEEANIRRGSERRQKLILADEALARLWVYIRLSVRLGWISAGQYEYVSERMVEVGKLLGGWQKVTHEGQA
ncbi:MAG: diversity-generating retroelement protein Avd [Bacteroidales bacterium]|nr:diversity-generating retroelement protein Avd [Bacteroidales bacterium]